MPDKIIDQIYAMADKQGALPGLTYVRHNNEQIQEGDMDEIAPQDLEEAIDEIATQSTADGELTIDDIYNDEDPSDAGGGGEPIDNMEENHDGPIDDMEENHEDPEIHAEHDHDNLNNSHQDILAKNRKLQRQQEYTKMRGQQKCKQLF